MQDERTAMSSQIIPVEAFDCIVFGGTGDLAERKLLPALYHRQVEGQFTEPTRIIGASRSALSHEDYRKFAQDALKEHLKKGEYDEAEVQKFLQRLYYVSVDAKADQGWEALNCSTTARSASASSIWRLRLAFSARSRKRSATTS